MSLSNGHRLGPYEILAPLGAGGMGEVYRARDTRLHREVALKVLPHSADDADRRLRFEREAQAAARLKHPNVASVHDLGIENGTAFIVSELIDGMPLRSRLRQGALPPRTVTAIGAQIADALAAAHDESIVHRDIKPENVLLTPEDVVKVVDFGIAKLARPASDESATAMVTEPGVVVGTPSYMSPEQIQGGAIDSRSDIFSLGCVLFEMATGHRPFGGKTSAEMMAAVLRDEPRSPEELSAVPAPLAAIIMRCLDKRRSHRFQSARDLAFALRSVPLGAEPAVITAAPAAHGGAWRMAALAAIAGIIVASTGFTLLKSDPLPPPSVTVRQLTFDSGIEAFPNLSSDGTLIVYTGTAKGNRDIFLRDINGREAINLTADSAANDTQPALSPDGQQVAFWSDRDGGGIFLVSRTGGVTRRVTRSGFNPTWSPDGKQIAVSTEAVDWQPDSRSADEPKIHVYDIATGASRVLPTADAVQPAWSPNGHRIAYWGLGNNRSQRDIWTVALNGQPIQVTNDPAMEWDPSWSPDGRWLYFSSDRAGTMNLWRVAIDEVTGVTRSTPEAVTLPASWTGHARVGALGQIVFASFQRTGNLDRVPFDAVRARFTGRPEPLTTGSNIFTAPQPSKDGRLLAFLGQSGAGRNVFVASSTGTNILQVTTGPYRESSVAWNPSSNRVAFFTARSGRYELFAVNADGTELQQLTDGGTRGLGRAVWSHDGTKIATLEAVTNRAFVVDLTGPLPVKSPEPLPSLSDGSQLSPYAWSFDDTRLLGTSTNGAVVVYSFRDRTYRQLAARGSGGPRWLPDGRRVIYSINDEFFLVDEQSGRIERIGRSDEIETIPEARANLAWSLSWDGAWLYRSRFVVQSDLWLMSPAATSSK